MKRTGKHTRVGRPVKQKEGKVVLPEWEDHVCMHVRGVCERARPRIPTKTKVIVSQWLCKTVFLCYASFSCFSQIIGQLVRKLNRLVTSTTNEHETTRGYMQLRIHQCGLNSLECG